MLIGAEPEENVGKSGRMKRLREQGLKERTVLLGKKLLEQD